ncbi:hypothetical protein K438DRAFT_1940008 [Mycena galopus ATCC 62051]|nr:hypothetical protein K438DRAFT_1940008 [Mycena galopus ATCC 62051]
MEPASTVLTWPNPPIHIQVLAAWKNQTLSHNSEEIDEARLWLLTAEKELQCIEDSDSARREKLLESIDSSKGTDTLEKTLVVVRAQEVLRRLEERRAALIKCIQVYRAAFSPHRILPFDVLREIFACCTYPSGRRQPPRCVPADLNCVMLGNLDVRQAISCVCSSWRFVAIHSPELWTNVRAVFGQAATGPLLRLLPHWFSRAQDSLLTLDFDLNTAWSADLTLKRDKNDRLIADFLAQYSPRCRVIRTRFLRFPTPRPFLSSEPAASLETLVLDDISFTGPPLAPSAAPRIHSLTLKALPLAALKSLQTYIQWDHLKAFFVDNLPRSYSVISVICGILTRCTTLRMAEIAILPDTDEEPLHIPYPELQLSELRFLRLRTDYLFNSARFLTGITAHSLTELTINVLRAKDQKVPHPPQLPNLRLLTLDLKYDAAMDVEVIPWLRAAPALQEAYLLDYTPLGNVLAKFASGILLPSVETLVLGAADLSLLVEMLEARQQDPLNSTISQLGFISMRFRESDWNLKPHTADALVRLFNAGVFVASAAGGFRTPGRIERFARRDFTERRAAFSRRKVKE